MKTINLKDTEKLSFNGDRIYSTDAGPYKYAVYVTTFYPKKEWHWCSRDGEACFPIDLTQYKVEGHSETD